LRCALERARRDAVDRAKELDSGLCWDDELDEFEGARGCGSRQRPQAIDAVRSGSKEALHSDGCPERIDKVLNAKPAQMVQPEQVFLERPPSWHRKMPADPQGTGSVIA